MSESVGPSAPASQPNAENEFVFVIHQESSAGQYNQFLFKRMFKQTELSDVTLRCEGRDILAHRIVLAAHSPFFVKQFEEKPANGLTIAIDNVKYDILMAAIELMYHGTVSVEPQLEPALSKLMENFEMSGTMCNPMDLPANVVHQVVDENVEKKKKAIETTNIEEKRQRPPLHDVREMSTYDQFVSSIDEIIRTVTKDNIEAKAIALLRHNIYTKERLVTVVNLMMRQVISIACETATICYAQLSAAIKLRDPTSSGFSSILLNVCQTFFTANIERKLVKPDCSHVPTLNAFDLQIHTLRMIEYQYSRERLRRIVRFLSELYTQNVINSGVLLEIQAKEMENLEHGIHDCFFVLLAIFDAAGKMLSEEHPTYVKKCVATLKQRLNAMENNQVLADVKALIAQAIEMSESGWKNESSPDMELNKSLPNSDVEEHLYWIKNSVARQPAKLTYHLARNNADQNREPQRRGKPNANKPQAKVQKQTPIRGVTIKSNEGASNAAKNTSTPRSVAHRERLPTVERLQGPSNQPPAHLSDATNKEPTSGCDSEEANKKRTRTRKRKERRTAAQKLLAEKIASKKN